MFFIKHRVQFSIPTMVNTIKDPYSFSFFIKTDIARFFITKLIAIDSKLNLWNIEKISKYLEEYLFF